MNETREAPPSARTESRESAPRPTDDHPPVHPKSKRPLSRRPLLVAGLFLLLLAVAVSGTLWWLHLRHYEATDDAFIDVTPQQVSPQIAGRVTRVLVADNQLVAAGTVLLELDSADAQTAVDEARAATARADAQVAQAEAQQAAFAAQAEQARANLGVAQTEAENDDTTLRRLAALRQDDTGAVSAEQWDRATAAEKSATARVQAASKAVSAADAQIHYAGSLIAAARAAQATAAAQLEHASLLLSYAQVKAMLPGRVASRNVAPGNFVQPGTALMAIVPTDVHVTANFKETQLARIRPGQPVAIEVDAYPDLELTGRIDSVQAGTGQTFSALPAENATGNWVKVVQRVPVKIALDPLPPDARVVLGAGFSVTVKVTVR